MADVCHESARGHSSYWHGNDSVGAIGYGKAMGNDFISLEAIEMVDMYAVIVVAAIFILVSISDRAFAQPDAESKTAKSEVHVEVDSDSQQVLKADYRFRWDIKNEDVEAVLEPQLSYRQDRKIEVNLENAYIRYPMGVFSFYGSGKAVALSCYYKKFGKGFYAGVTQENDDGFWASELEGARTVTMGMVLPQAGEAGKHDLKWTYTNILGDSARRRYQILSLENERAFNSGDKCRYILSYNDRTYDGERMAQYSTLRLSYEQLVRKGFTVRWDVGVTYNYDDRHADDVRRWSPVVAVKLHMDL